MTPELKEIVMHMESLNAAERARAYLSILASWNLPDEGRTVREKGLIAGAYHWTHSDPVSVAAAHEVVEYIVDRLNDLDVPADRVGLDLRDVSRFLPADEGYDPAALAIAAEIMGLTRRGDTTVWATDPHVAVTHLAPVPTPRGRRRSDSIGRAS